MSRLSELFQQTSKAKILSGLTLGLTFGLGVFLRLEALSEVTLNEWIIRDFDRTFNLIDGAYFPLAGPETDLGGRLPGPFMYMFLSLPLLIHYSYESLFIFNFILNIASVAMLFRVLIKNFDFYIAALTSGLLSLNLYHIGAVNFPFNPSFIFPFVVVAIGILLELVEKRTSKDLTLLVVIICLGIQFHYSVALLIAVSIFLVAIFRVQIPAKIWMAMLVATLICFLPFALHKAQTFAPANTGGTFTFKEPPTFSLLSIVKMAAAQNTIARIAGSKRTWNGNPLEDAVRLAWRLTLSLALYGLLFHVVRRSYVAGIRSCSKEIAVVTLFYLPALIYEIVNPNTMHYWYTFIFAIPQALLISVAVNTLFRSGNKIVRQTTLATTLATVVGLSYFSYHYSRSFVNPPWSSPSDYYGYKYRDSSAVLKALMKELKLSPRGFYDRVFLPDFRPASLKRLELIEENLSASQQRGDIDQKLSCYFIIDPRTDHEKTRRNRDEFQRLQKANLIIVENTQPVILVNDRFSKIFMVFKYKPNYRQSCYNNSFNAFAVTQSVRNLFRKSKKLSHTPHFVLSFDKLSGKEDYNDQKELVFFEKEYVIFNTHTQIPFRFRLTIDKRTVPYFLRGEIENHYPFAIPNFRMKNLAVNLIMSDVYRFEILPEQRLTNFPWGVANQFDISFNKWFREIPFPEKLNLIAKQFRIELEWDIEWINKSSVNPSPIAPPGCCRTVQKNKLNLK